MDRKRHRSEGPPAIDLVEESVHLLRRLPASAWIHHAIGTVPFALAMLFFLADMSRGAAADGRLAVSALWLTLLYLWMKDRQSAFAAELRSGIHGSRPEPVPIRQRWNRLLFNAVIHPTGLLLIPLSAVLTIPFPWCVAFYQNASALADGSDPSLRRNIARCARQATLWTGQNVSLQLVLQCFTFFVFLNWFITLTQFPQLVKTLFGIETAFTRSGMSSVFNTTYLFTVIALTWLCVSPLFRAVYTLRCFYGEALTTGEDLRGDLKTILSRKNGAVLAAMGLILVGAPAAEAASTAGGSTPPPTQQASTQARSSGKAAKSADSRTRVERLDRAFDEVLQQPEFAWRSPRIKSVEESEKGWLARQLEALVDWIQSVLLKVRDLVKKVIEWLFKYFKAPRSGTTSSESGAGWQATLELVVYLLVGAILITILLLLLRLRRRGAIRIAEATAVTPDLSDENVTADELPEDEWMRLAGELLGRGDARLALRALYLACLAHLGERGLLTISRAKSNREYQRELRRRARSLEELQAAFDANVLAFERAWYGAHEATQAVCDEATANLGRIRQC